MPASRANRDVFWILIAFAASRLVLHGLGLRMNSSDLFSYMQYLDVETLQHGLLRGVWYDHAQPPLFNLLLGVVLKCFGVPATGAFSAIMAAVSLANAVLLYTVTRRLLPPGSRIPLAVSLFYILGPTSMLYECELFYTQAVSFLLLAALYFLLRASERLSWGNAIGLFSMLTFVCLTRSLYHLAWLLVVTAVILVWFRRRTGFYRAGVAAVISIGLVAGWYLKNLLIFGMFTSSSWIGMNWSKNIFHHHPETDSTRIEAYEAFLDVQAYAKFLPPGYADRYRGLDDRDLLQPCKNDSTDNSNHIAYLVLSRQYLAADKARIAAHPMWYLRNLGESGLMFFTPATEYFMMKEKAQKIRYYDVAYSFNPARLAGNLDQRRHWLVVEALLKLAIYAAVIGLVLWGSWRDRRLSLPDTVILLTIAYVFTISTVFEYFENMRFRYEVEPLFLVLAAQALFRLRHRGAPSRRRISPARD